MPVVELNISRLQKLVGKNTNKKQILDRLPFLGLDIESLGRNTVRVEYSPNRPDYSTDFGIALGLQGILGINKGMLRLNVRNHGNYEIRVDSSTSKIRPFVTGIIARNGSLDDEAVKQIINMQEDLHVGLGRKRKKSSIGIHDLDNISFPLKYTTTSRDHRFVPLNSTKESSISEILRDSEVGRDYGSILGQSSKVPLITDAKGQTISFPPIINAALTTVTTKTKNLLVEVTGIDKQAAEDMLSVVVTILQGAGFQFSQLKVSGSKNSTPNFTPRSITFDVDPVNKILGLNISGSMLVSCLKKCRLDAVTKNKKIQCTIPRYRFDIFGGMDIVEEVALGYGIENLKPAWPASAHIGEKNTTSEKLDSISRLMTGFGFMEALNSTLASEQILYEMTNRDSSQIISVTSSKSQEHTILRDSILPGLLENLSKNIHETYPQKFFESGIVFSTGSPIKETVNLACVTASEETHFSEMKAVLQSLLRIGFNTKCETKTLSNHALFSQGRVAEIVISGKAVGYIGELDSKVLENFRIRTRVVGFEIKLSGLIFD
ncbi:phenylalanine--tRNA ligase subunit beta [Marine Group I thaumarchaeote]|uniref:phenylalanine--tRNA ligase n=1 Tax=Marine Group I thaumarchaeote TaxID=2511932 RepID=A0A7K4NUJ3_9ARCH|nr:phenylalanine--tRNA ligase subunit beta [Marine Group I thaumarchaeote]